MADEIEIPPTADQIQATKAERMSGDERQAADKAHKDASRAAKAKHHADRIAAGHAYNLAQATKLWIGAREVTIVRPAAEGDIGFIDSLPCSVVKFVDDGSTDVRLDSTIMTERVGPVVLSH